MNIKKFFIAFIIIAQLIAVESINAEYKIDSQYVGNKSKFIFNVIDFGAIGNGITIDTKSVQKAIDKCSVKGGQVLFPPGKYLLGSVELKSNVEIYLPVGAVILGSSNIKDYQPHSPKIKSYNDTFLKYSLFYAEDANNISLKGSGTIDGQGYNFKVTTKKKPGRYKNRPFIIRFVNCTNVTVEGVTLQNSAMWMQHYFGCKNLKIKNIKVYNHANQNNDMMDIDGCSDVLITGCFGDTDDDGITLKSTSPLLDDNIIISDCILSSHNNAIKLGTESTGGFHNISISNIVIKPSAVKSVIFGKPEGVCGIALEIVDGGTMDNVIVSNVIIDSVEVPLFIRLGNRARKYTQNSAVPGVGKIMNISLNNITATNAGSTGCSLSGINDHCIKNISLNNIRISYQGGGTLKDANKVIPELATHYPESTMWGNLPAYGFFIRNADGISLNNVVLNYNKQDIRPAIACDQTKNMDLFGIKAKCDSNASALFEFDNVENSLVQSSRSTSKIRHFIYLKGSGNSNIKLTGNDFTNVKEAIRGKSNKSIILKGNIK